MNCGSMVAPTAALSTHVIMVNLAVLIEFVEP